MYSKIEHTKCKTLIAKWSIPQTPKYSNRDYWMLNERFWSHTIIKQHQQVHYINLQTDPQANPLTTGLMRTGSEISIVLYPNRQFGWVDDQDCQFGDHLIPTRTRTQSDGQQLFLIVRRAQRRWLQQKRRLMDRLEWLLPSHRDLDGVTGQLGLAHSLVNC